MCDGKDFLGVKWISEPDDGFLCLVVTRRTLDVNGHCCDYERCKATRPMWGGPRLDRCLLAPDHESDHHSSSCRSWRD